MPRLMICVATLVWLVGTNVVRADWEQFWHRFHVDSMRMNCWPKPFVHADRETVRMPLIAMTAAGWRMQNTLSDHLFDSTTQSLTQAGKLKVHWIVSQAPEHRRTVFVLRGADERSTHERMDSVRQSMGRMASNERQPEVMLTNTIPAGGSGAYFDEVDRQLKASVPPPRLPARESTTDGG